MVVVEWNRATARYVSVENIALRAAFDRFKVNADSIIAELNSALFSGSR